LRPSNSFALTLLADPHPLTPIASIFYKNIEGQGASTSQYSSRISRRPSPFPPKLFRINTCKNASEQPPLTIFRINTCRSVSKQRTLTRDYVLDEGAYLRVFSPKPKVRLPERRHMTIAIGFRCMDGLVVCADTQETIADIKTDTQKIRSFHYTDKFAVVMVGAGSSDYVDNAIEDITDGLGLLRQFTWIDLYKNIKVSYLNFFDTALKPWAVYPQDERPDIGLILAIAIKGQVWRLLRIRGTALTTVHRFCCSGMGILVGQKLCKELYSATVTTQEMASLAIHILDEIKSGVSGCGGNSDIVLLDRELNYTHLPTEEVEKLERKYKTFKMNGTEQLAHKILNCPIQLKP
jgi:hypothetical protein